MGPCFQSARSASFASTRLIALAVVGSGCLMAFGIAGCAANEPVGHSKTTTKKVIDTPTEKTTVTETREKDTKFTPR